MIWAAWAFMGLVLVVCAAGIWLRWYYDTYNEDFFDARRRGTLWKFRCTQHPLYPGW